MEEDMLPAVEVRTSLAPTVYQYEQDELFFAAN